ncbi:MAG: hypothetical protein AB1601_15445 [Planctomycetota bacterium]
MAGAPLADASRIANLDGLEAVIRAWPTLGANSRSAILEIISRDDRWREFVAWAGQAAAKLIAEALQAGWRFKGKPRPAKTGSWYLSFECAGRKLTVRLANHHRPLRNVLSIVWDRGHEKAIEAAVRSLRMPTVDMASAATG